MELDEFDRAILSLVQIDARKSHSEIGQAVNLSASSVRRRLIALQDAGIILGHVALTDPAQLGLTFITHIAMTPDTPEQDSAFRQTLSQDPAISQIYSISGDYDFALVVHAVSPEAYEHWAETRLMTHPQVQRYTSALVWSRVKFSTAVSPAQNKGPGPKPGA